MRKGIDMHSISNVEWIIPSLLQASIKGIKNKIHGACFIILRSISYAKKINKKIFHYEIQRT